MSSALRVQSSAAAGIAGAAGAALSLVPLPHWGDVGSGVQAGSAVWWGVLGSHPRAVEREKQEHSFSC